MHIAMHRVETEYGCANLSLFLHDQIPGAEPSCLKPLMVVLPGGGYNHLSTREGEPVALRWFSLGFNACILHYSVAPAQYPVALIELASTVGWIRSNSKTLNVDKGRIYVCGFSAGGHLAGCLGAKWADPALSKATKLCQEVMRPDALVLCYPVISAGQYGHHDSFKVLCGDNTELAASLSLENLVTKSFPPTFIWHTADDRSVSVENSLLLASALSQAKVEFTLHIFPHGGHGSALATRETALAGHDDQIQPLAQLWPELCAQWLSSIS